ncbi:MAG TPA: hypothetical protein VMA53_12470 [Stellaceae bacterium]|nr:hypothetical protein [Stellaceae bacterium]
MMRWSGAFAALFLLAGCSGGARDVDYTPDRGISADIAASHSPGSSSLYPGISGTSQSDEPLGLLPWLIGERHE